MAPGPAERDRQVFVIANRLLYGEADYNIGKAGADLEELGLAKLVKDRWSLFFSAMEEAIADKSFGADSDCWASLPDSFTSSGQQRWVAVCQDPSEATFRELVKASGAPSSASLPTSKPPVQTSAHSGGNKAAAAPDSPAKNTRATSAGSRRSQGSPTPSTTLGKRVSQPSVRLRNYVSDSDHEDSARAKRQNTGPGTAQNRPSSSRPNPRRSTAKDLKGYESDSQESEIAVRAPISFTQNALPPTSGRKLPPTSGKKLPSFTSRSAQASGSKVRLGDPVRKTLSSTSQSARSAKSKAAAAINSLLPKAQPRALSKEERRHIRAGLKGVPAEDGSATGDEFDDAEFSGDDYHPGKAAWQDDEDEGGSTMDEEERPADKRCPRDERGEEVEEEEGVDSGPDRLATLKFFKKLRSEVVDKTARRTGKLYKEVDEKWQCLLSQAH
ncbi:hypothetical protein V8E36_003652 [Tilletia maclaganii]